MIIRKALIPVVLLCAAGLAVWSARAHEGEHHSAGGNGQPGGAPLVAMGFTPCVNGTAGPFPCNKVDLASLLPIADIDGTTGDSITANDVWGWTDPQTDREFALLGLSNGVAFVEVTNPSAPVYLGNLPGHTSDSLWRGLKVYRDHLYVVSEASGHGMQVFDLTRLRAVASPPQVFAETAHYDNFASAHTIAVNEETGYAYVAGSRPGAGHTPGLDTCSDTAGGTGGGRVTGRGLHVVDLRDPAAPRFAGCVDDDGYTHETQCVVYRGPDAEHRGREVCFSSNEDTLTVVDVTDKAAPAQLSRTPYAGSGYTHQGWLTGDQTRFLLDDETDELRLGLTTRTRTFVWDVSDLDAPTVRGVYQGQTTAIDHNLYVRGLYAFESNYRSGLRVLDVRGAADADLAEVAFFDVYTEDDRPLFNGSWSNYPFLASGTVLASGIEQGLFVLRPQVDLPVRIDYEPFFVRQQYRDFLGREPDAEGLAFWTHELEACMGDRLCREVKRVNVSAAFFLSIEFQETGYLAYRLHKASFGAPPAFAAFNEDARQIGRGVVVGREGWEQELESNKRAFVEAWVQRPDFLAEFPAGMTAEDYVSKLFTRAGAGLTITEYEAALGQYGAGGVPGRARSLRAVVESHTVALAHTSPAFVLMQYFGYLRRDPDAEGFDFWLSKLNHFHGNFVEAEMVKAFLSSIEYRRRFGQ